MNIKYLTFYDTKANSEEKRTFSPACKSVSEYIVSVLNDDGFSVDIISPIGSNNPTGFYYTQKRRLNKHTVLYLPCSCGNKGLFRKILHGILQRIATLFFPLFKINRNDIVLVYHSVGLYFSLLLLKRIMKCRIILQVEEVYGDVDHSFRCIRKEKRCFSTADAFIFATNQLESRINTDNKPYCILNGNYSLKNDYGLTHNSRLKKCVYAGTFNLSKRGAINAIEMARYLSHNYEIHIVGFGTDKEVSVVQEKISESNTKNECQCYYDGMLLDDELDKYIQGCDVGLCTQDSRGDFNLSSFPSKIFMYLTNGLPVVSTNTPVIIGTAIEKIVFISEDDSPEKIAQTVLLISNDDKKQVKSILHSLDLRFRVEFHSLISEFIKK